MSIGAFKHFVFFRRFPYKRICKCFACIREKIRKILQKPLDKPMRNHYNKTSIIVTMAVV